MVDKGAAGKTLSMQDWEQIMQDFRTSSELQQKWLTIWPGLALVEQALLIVLKKENTIKSQLLVFIEENADILIGSEVHLGFGMLLESLRGVLQSPADGVIITSTIRENMMVMVTAVAIVTDALHNAKERLEGLVELFLGFINRPNQSSDRHVRGLACECLRELEMAYPCLLFGCVGHIHFLCQSERTHANQSYTLLLATIIENLSTRMYTLRSKSANYMPIIQSKAPPVHFSVPFFLVSSAPGNEIKSIPTRELTPGNLKEFRKIVAFLLERPQLLTSMGLLELVSCVIEISKVIDLSGPSLKSHFSHILHTYRPVLCHIVLLVYTNFIDTLDGNERIIAKRLIALARDDSQSLAFRLLGVHWLMGMEAIQVRNQKQSIMTPHYSGLYPSVFDPLSLKAEKLGALAHCAVSLEQQNESVTQGKGGEGNGVADPTGALLNEALLSVSSFEWLPPWSTETQLAFHVFHRFLTMAFPHGSKAHEKEELEKEEVAFRESPLFLTLQKVTVTTVAGMRKLVPNLVALLDRLMGCNVHRVLGERLLRTCNESLLPELNPNHHLPSYFPLLERIAKNREIPPGALIDKITMYIRQRVEEDHADDDECVLWGRSTQVLGICRTVLLHHKSSRVFHSLAPLLAFLCRFFPDLEVRDTARLYLRMLLSVPGDKLRSILKYSDAGVDEASASQVPSILRPQSPPLKGSQGPLAVASYVHLTRVNPLLVRHSWSIVLFDTYRAASGNEERFPGTERKKQEIIALALEMGEPVPNLDDEQLSTIIKSQDESSSEPSLSHSKTPLRMMDARTSEIILVLRRHFAEIPDYFNSSGLKITVPCTLRYYGDYLNKFEDDGEPIDSPLPSSSPTSEISDSWPAIYAIVITLKTSGYYGPIPKVRVPFLLSEPPQRTRRRSSENLPGINEDSPVQSTDRKGKGIYYLEDSPSRGGGKRTPSEAPDDNRLTQYDSANSGGLIFHEFVNLELEPKQPVPTLVDVHLDFNDDEGNGVAGQMSSIPVGIEDLFLQPPVPVDLFPALPSDYLPNLFDALWEACSGPGRLGTETFSLKGAYEAVSITGAESVKLLEAQVDRVVAAVEQYLAPFVVSVEGVALKSMARDGRMFQGVRGLQEESVSSGSELTTVPHMGSQLKRNVSNENFLQIQVRDPAMGGMEELRRGLGTFLVLILLPPRYHLLLRMEVADQSTMVRIRTDHWPCLAHIDEYLEALVAG